MAKSAAVRVRDLASGGVRTKTYVGDRDVLEKLKTKIQRHRAAHKPPDTAIHTPVPKGVRPGGFIASFLVVDPIQIADE